MDDPWQFLILDPHTATERDVKAAYARLLKQHRPDRDPEGFRKLREAYEAALGAVGRRNASTVPPPSYATAAHDEADAARPGLVLPFREEALPEKARAAFGDLQHAAGTNNDEQMQAAVAHYESVCRAENLPASTLSGGLQKAFHEDAKLTARGMTDEVLVRLAEEGQTDFCHVIVSVWQDREDRTRLATLGGSLLKRCALLASPDGAGLMARVGLLVTLEFPAVAAALANAAFPHLAVEGREHLIGQLEHGVALGKIFADVFPAERAFWFRLLRGTPAAQDWSAPDARHAVNHLLDAHNFQWGGWGVVSRLMTPAVWAPVEQKLRKQANRAGGGKSFVSRILVVPGIFVLIALVRIIASLGGTGYHDNDDYNRRQYDQARETLHRYEQLRDHAGASRTSPPFAVTPLAPMSTRGNGVSSFQLNNGTSQVTPLSSTPDRNVLYSLRGPGDAPSPTTIQPPAPQMPRPAAPSSPTLQGIFGNTPNPTLRPPVEITLPSGEKLRIQAPLTPPR